MTNRAILVYGDSKMLSRESRIFVCATEIEIKEENQIVRNFLESAVACVRSSSLGSYKNIKGNKYLKIVHENGTHSILVPATVAMLLNSS